MPTGYTAKLYEGEDQTFEEFVLSCARAFGALITMRDESPDAPIPDEFEASDYYLKALEKDTARLAELEAMTPDEATAAADEAWQKDQEARQRARERRAAVRGRYEAMLAQVKAWEPPTPDHVELRKFMIDQLTQSISFDGTEYEWPGPSRDGGLWREQQLAEVRRAITRDRDEYAREVQRANERTAWVKALRDSLAERARA